MSTLRDQPSLLILFVTFVAILSYESSKQLHLCLRPIFQAMVREHLKRHPAREASTPHKPSQKAEEITCHCDRQFTHQNAMPQPPPPLVADAQGIGPDDLVQHLLENLVNDITGEDNMSDVDNIQDECDTLLDYKLTEKQKKTELERVSTLILIC